MRRSLVLAVLAVLAAPALAAAQSIAPGQIVFADYGTDLEHGPWISRYECRNATSAAVLSWNTQLVAVATLPADAHYQVYASNRQPPGSACITAGNGVDVRAGPVGSVITGQGQTVANQWLMVGDVLAAAGLASCASVADAPVYVCVQAYDSGGTAVGVATGTMTLSLSAPGEPTGLTVTPSDGALAVSWTAPTGNPPAHDYSVTALAAGPTDTSVHVVATTGTSVLVEGLANGQEYQVEVSAFSQAGNPSIVVATYGTPVASHGSGGCGTGGAGPLALLAGAALVARLLARRRVRAR